jgi:hypothetical protein
VRFFSRSRRWRQAFFAACLPYILVSVFVESLHDATRPDADDVIAVTSASVAIGAAGGSATDPYSCPVCAWLNVGTQQVQQVAIVATGDAVRALAVLLAAEWADSPVPHPALFRGPPRLA